MIREYFSILSVNVQPWSSSTTSGWYFCLLCQVSQHLIGENILFNEPLCPQMNNTCQNGNWREKNYFLNCIEMKTRLVNKHMESTVRVPAGGQKSPCVKSYMNPFLPQRTFKIRWSTTNKKKTCFCFKKEENATVSWWIPVKCLIHFSWWFLKWMYLE